MGQRKKGSKKSGSRMMHDGICWLNLDSKRAFHDYAPISGISRIAQILLVISNAVVQKGPRHPDCHKIPHWLVGHHITLFFFYWDPRWPFIWAKHNFQLRVLRFSASNWSMGKGKMSCRLLKKLKPALEQATWSPGLFSFIEGVASCD